MRVRMMINFTQEQWGNLKRTYKAWWDGSLQRPIVPTLVFDAEKEKYKGEYPMLSFMTSFDESIPVKDIVKRYDGYFGACTYLGDGFPYINCSPFGPGVVAALLGCNVNCTPETIWFEPQEKRVEISELHFEYDENNKYFNRILNFYEAAMDQWHGEVILGMIDLGGILDILASFRTTQGLLYDLYDEPEEVVRCVKELQEMWFFFFDKVNAYLGDRVQGHTHWLGAYSEQPSCILQSDFSFMIGNDQFKEFVEWELDSSAKRLHNTFYHMDGKGELTHLACFLAMEGIKAIQWQPGSGDAGDMDWSELCQKILASGKKLQFDKIQKADGTLPDYVKNPGALMLPGKMFYANEMEKAKAYLAGFGAE